MNIIEQSKQCGFGIQFPNCWDTQYDIVCNGNEFLMIFDVVF